MSLQALPSPFEIAGGGNPYYDPSSNIAGLSALSPAMRLDLPGDYDRYMQEASPFLAGLGEGEFETSWPIVTVAAAYGYMRSGHNPIGLFLGLLGGLYFPRATAVLYGLDAALSHEGTRQATMQLMRR